PSHPYGRPVEGTRESVARLTRDDVVKFHREHFRPDATVVAVVGAVTVDEARREILARFGSWPRPAAPLAAVPSASAGRERHEEAIARDLTQATIVLGRQAIRQTDADYFPLWWPRTCSAAARPHACTRGSARKRGSRTPCTATSHRRSTARRSS